MNEKMMDVVVSQAELYALPDEYRQEMLAELPQDDNDCYIYSFLVTPVLLNKLEHDGLNLLLISNYLHGLFESEQYHAMHLYLIMCFRAMEVDIPPFFQEFPLNDALLERLMYEILQEIEDYIEFDDFQEEVSLDE